MNIFSKRPVAVMLVAVPVIVISIAVLVHSLRTEGLLQWGPDQSPPAGSTHDKIADHGTHLVYVPAGASLDRKCWLIFALFSLGGCAFDDFEVAKGSR